MCTPSDRKELLTLRDALRGPAGGFGAGRSRPHGGHAHALRSAQRGVGRTTSDGGQPRPGIRVSREGFYRPLHQAAAPRVRGSRGLRPRPPRPPAAPEATPTRALAATPTHAPVQTRAGSAGSAGAETDVLARPCFPSQVPCDPQDAFSR